VFAELLVGAPLWGHQLEVVRSTARYRVLCAGRQVGKSRLFAILALHQAFAVPNSTVLLVSAGDTASKRLLEEVASLALASPFLSGSIVEDTSKMFVLSNGSKILSVPASQRQIRGWPVDLLIVDEAGFIDQEVWRSAEPTIIARPGSRVLLCSTPWGGPEHFFRQLWRRGMDAPDDHVASWHWPSTASPLVDAELLAEIQGRESPHYFAMEYLAEWVDDVGAYFSEAELAGAVADYELVPPAEAGVKVGQWVVGGVDWGFARDANALAVVGPRDADERGRTRFWVPWVEAQTGMPYADWIDYVVSTSSLAGDGYHYGSLVCELNGVGMMPSQVLNTRMTELGGHGLVYPVTTSTSSKENAFGYIKLLLQQRRLDLPNHPELLKQLRGLQFEVLPSGGMRIAVPERLGHDDLAMAFAMAVSAVMGLDMAPVDDRIYGMEDVYGEDWENEMTYLDDGTGRIW
jgi:hypothetical protein